MIFKNKLTGSSDPRHDNGKLIGGRRGGESENPYLSARRTWNDHTGGVVAGRKAWTVMGIMSMLVALTGVGGMIYIGKLSKFVPVVVEVDKLGRTVAVAVVDRASPVEAREIKPAIEDFISNARLVTPDVALQRKAILEIYAMLGSSDPALQKMTEWINGTEESNPFKRAAKEMVSIEIVNALPQTPDTWEVDWVETVRDRQGVAKDKPAYWRALITVKIVPHTPDTSEEQLTKNPMGIYVSDFSWSRQQPL